MDVTHQNDKDWILGVQTRLYQWSRDHPGETYRDLWGWVTDPRNLRWAWRTIASNRGRRTPGIDGMTVADITREVGVEAFLRGLRAELRNGGYRPAPSRRKWIPKPGKKGRFRPLGIPTIRDRVVQCAVKQILEPLFEARFWQVSYGFRPGRGCHGALEHIRQTIRPRRRGADGRRHEAPYQWVIEGDIEGCFDRIDHHHLMERVRLTVADHRVNRLILRFLKAGVLEDFKYNPTHTGTPQGGVISPLLANIALSVIEERYSRWVRRTKGVRGTWADPARGAAYARQKDRKDGRPVFYPVRYADDFVVLVSGSEQDALAEKQALADWLEETAGLRLSPEKTRVTALREGFAFLGCRVRLKWDDRFGLHARIEIPQGPIRDLRHRIKGVTGRQTLLRPLPSILREINPVLRGWSAYYRHCIGAKSILNRMDWYVNQRLWLWLRAKHKGRAGKSLARMKRPSRDNPRRRVWQEDGHEQYLMARRPVVRFELNWMRKPDFARVPGEPDA